MKILAKIDRNITSRAFELEPYISWREFDACFYALKMNALLILGKPIVTLKELLNGARIEESMLDVPVRLVPTKVRLCDKSYDRDSIKEIATVDAKAEQNEIGCLTLTCNGSGMVDIVFILRDARDGTEIIFHDQRKNQCGLKTPSSAIKALRKPASCPELVEKNDVRVIRGFMNVTTFTNSNASSLPPDSYIFCTDEHQTFYGTLHYHPACSPLFSIDSMADKVLEKMLSGNQKDVKYVVKDILGKRKEISGGFCNYNEVASFLREH